jgi:hypothetical protein
MAIITLAQYKTLLGVTTTDATRDARISALIPDVEAFVVEYTNNAFTNEEIAFTGDFTPTVAGGPVYTLACADGGIVAAGFASGDCFTFAGSKRNDGRRTSTAITDTLITVSDVLVAEAEVASTIVLIQYPVGLQSIAARMIAYQLDHAASAGMQSETIKSYSYSRQSNGAADAMYPAEILRGLDKWRNLKVGYGSVRQQFNDLRGNWIGGTF